MVPVTSNFGEMMTRLGLGGQRIGRVPTSKHAPYPLVRNGCGTPRKREGHVRSGLNWKEHDVVAWSFAGRELRQLFVLDGVAGSGEQRLRYVLSMPSPTER